MPVRVPIALAREIEREIHWLRGQRVALDYHLAAVYGVSTSHLNYAVRRNRSRFPPDFMFALTAAEVEFLRSQFVISKAGRGGRRTRPYAFTEPGVAMLSSVLRGERAIRMNIAVMRAFVHLRHMMMEDATLRPRVERLESGQQRVAGVLDALLREIGAGRPRRRRGHAIGFAASAH